MDKDVAFLEFLQYTFSILLSRPEEASIRSEHRGDGNLVFHVSLHADDVGKVIGRNGHTISAIRNLLDAGALRAGVKVVLRVDERGDEYLAGAEQTETGAESEMTDALQAQDTDHAEGES